MASRISQPPSRPESLAPHESLFPFAPQSVVEGLANLENSSNDMLQLLTEARGRYGAANQLYANLPLDELVDWHVANHDFEPEGALLYKAGLLYGKDLAQHVHRTTDFEANYILDDVDAFQKAVNYLRDTYRGLDDENEVNWQRQKERELLYTGSDIMSLVNATLQDTVVSRLHRLGISVEANALAQHVGIVDGVIFLDAYRAYSRGAEPLRFEAPVQEFIPTYDPKIHEQAGLTDLCARYEFEHISEVLQIVEGMEELQGDIVNGRSPAGTIYHARRRMVQTGPNAFTTAAELTSIEAPRYSLKRIGSFALLGGGVDLAYIVFDSNLPLRFVPLATLLNGAVGLLFERLGRKAVKKEATERNITFHVSGQQ